MSHYISKKINKEILKNDLRMKSLIESVIRKK